ncbi:hypothetical protein FA15DRAFT_241511 [Coprinopsis marcescibilis]|uniref:NADP-dependent oxidoreductase domain-containing protein n=1 Tax=Coprinopsis marcescibilis TaxID=230819 RepID=A0A5C3KFI2_COPMA|nr:hypothetical protein FA15DRAFT_241511 [Coprinopsis marcescibilis]
MRSHSLGLCKLTLPTIALHLGSLVGDLGLEREFVGTNIWAVIEAAEAAGLEPWRSCHHRRPRQGLLRAQHIPNQLEGTPI